MMQAVLIGETARLERVWTDDFRRTGTFHALVISGIHVTVLAAVLLFLLRWLPLSELSALAVTAAAAWLYALVSGFSAPVVRAAGGFTLYTLARACFRRARVMNLLAAVALVYLAWDPAQIFEASFQLSFLCRGGHRSAGRAAARIDHGALRARSARHRQSGSGSASGAACGAISCRSALSRGNAVAVDSASPALGAGIAGRGASLRCSSRSKWW